MKYLFLISCFFFNFFISYSQDLDLKKTNIKLEEKNQDIIERTSVKINYSYLSGLDLFYSNNQDIINGSKSGIISLSFHYRANKWKYGIGINFSNYKASYKYYVNISYRILTPFVTFERYVYKNLYVGVHLGYNFIKSDSYFYEGYNIYLPYTKFCAGYQFKLSNRLNFNLELGVGGSMTNTGFAYLFR